MCFSHLTVQTNVKIQVFTVQKRNMSNFPIMPLHNHSAQSDSCVLGRKYAEIFHQSWGKKNSVQVSCTGLDKVSGHPVLWEFYLTSSDPFFVGKEKECAVLEELQTKGSVTDGQCNTEGAIICAEARQILRGWVEKRLVINPVKVV